jgi:adenine-specific DNA-methyltransferase
MSRLTELIRQAKEKDPALGAELEREYRTLSGRLAFGLNFERHRPEAVELPSRPVRRGDKVRILPPRGSLDRGDGRLWRVVRVEKEGAERLGHLEPLGVDDREPIVVSVDDLVVVAEFRDPINPGFVSTGSVQRGADKPVQTVINGENFHVLKALSYTHRGRIDVIYIDPPYNTGARDWKYNNDYVESDDLYRHSKWLAFIERRLLLAKALLNPDDSVLIVTIDEKEYLRLGLLLEQTFPEARIQMISVTISPRGTSRVSEFSRVDEYAFFVFLGSAAVARVSGQSGEDVEVRWQYLRRTQKALTRGSRPNQFYPIYVDTITEKIVKVGVPIGPDDDLADVPKVPDAVPVFPIDPGGLQLIWGLTPSTLESAVEKGFVRVTRGNEHQPYTISHLSTTNIARAEAGDGLRIVGIREDGSKIVVIPGGKVQRSTTVWREARHDAGAYGTSLIRALLGGRSFPFPKSLYVVEDTLRFFISDKPNAVILDFFAGSGTTAHAVMRLNKQDGGGGNAFR